MKTKFKRTLCLVLALCVCLTLLPQFFGIFADESDPKLPIRCKNVIYETKIEGSFGTKLSALRTSVTKKFSANTDISGMESFDVDVFIDSVSDVLGIINEDQTIQFGFSSGTLNNASNHAEADISSQLKKDGWNHISVKKSDFVETNINWTKVRHVFLRLKNESGSMPAAISGDAVKMMNVCETYALPNVSDDGVMISETEVGNTLGDSGEALIGDTFDRLSTTFAAKDISGLDIIKAEVFIPDFPTFAAFTADNELQFTFVSEGGSATAAASDAYIANAEAGGWYTVQFMAASLKETGSFDATKVTGIKAGFASEAGAKLEANHTIKFEFMYVRGFVIDSTTVENGYGKKVSDFCESRVATAIGGEYSSIKASKSGSFKAIGSADYIEFDLYVSSAENFRSAFADTDSLKLVLSGAGNKLTFENVQKQIIKTGWNHIILPVAEATDGGFDKTTDFDKIEFAASIADMSSPNPAKGEIIMAENFVSTKGTAASGKLKFDKLADISAGKSVITGDTFNASAISGTVANANVKDAKFVEFDIYIQNFSSFKTEMAAKGITDISIRLSSAGGSGSADILGAIAQNGWNHIAVPFVRFTSNTTGTFDPAAVSGWSLLFGGTTAAATDYLKGQTIAISGISAVQVIDPSLPANAVTIISENGKSGVYGANYSTLAANSVIALAEPVDATAGSKLELDYYVEDINTFNTMANGTENSLCLALATTSDKKGVALYSLGGLINNDGWNHIELKSNSYDTVLGDSEANLKTVYYAYLTFGDDNNANPSAAVEFNIKNLVVSLDPIDILPASPDYEVVVSKTGTAPKSWGKQYNYTMDRIYIAISPAVDLSGMDLFEFDIYIDDADAFKSAVNGKALRFYFASGASRFNNRSTYDFVNQVTQDGWNHIVVDKTLAVNKDSTDFSSIKWAGLVFWNGSGQDNPIADTPVRIANIGANVAEYNKLPPISSYEVVVSSSGTNAKGWGDQYNYTADRIYTAVDSVDLSGADIIEFDIYIKDKDAFSSAVAGKSLRFFVASGDTRFKNRSAYAFENQVTEDGWNHIKLDKLATTSSAEADFSSIKWIGLAFWSGSTDSLPIKDTIVRIANVGANIADYNKLPVAPEFDITLSLAGTKPKTWGDQYNWAVDRIYAGIEPVDMSSADIIEFDIYIDDYDAFKAAEYSGSLKFFMASGDTRFKDRSAYSVAKQITKTGWNHIAVDKLLTDGAEDADFSSIKWIGLAFWSGAGVTNPLKDTVVRIANVGANTAEYNKLPAAPEFDITLSLAGTKPKTWGDQYNWAVDRIYTAVDPADVSLAGTFEFDIYIDDYSEFKAAEHSGSLKFFMASGDTRFKDRSAYSVAKQITKSGWNHIVVDKLLTDGAEDADFSSVKWIGLAFWNGNGVANPLKNTVVRIANIGANIAEYNKLPEAAKHDTEISLAGTKPKTWGKEYNWAADRIYTEVEPVDVSLAGRFEFDIYIDDYDDFKAAEHSGTLRFFMASGDTRFKDRSAYSVAKQITKSGWNHIVVDKLLTDGAEDADFSSIKWIGLAFWSGAGIDNPLQNTTVRIVNVVASIANYNKPPATPDYDLLISKSGTKPKTWGKEYNWAVDRIVSKIDPIDLSGYDLFEFDIYIDDYDEFKAADHSGSLKFVLSSGETQHKERAAFSIAKQIKGTGWNHIVVDKLLTDGDNSADYTNIKWISLAFWNGAGIDNPIQNTTVRIVNIGANIAEYNKIPALPENVVAQLGKAEDNTDVRGNTVGDYFHWTLDRIYRQKLSPVDFSRAQVVEFDVYVSDYDKFLAAENDPTDKQKSKLNFVVSSTIPGLWDQYSKPYVYYSAGIDLAPYITHTGWNHVVVGKAEFVTYNHGVNWSGLTGYMIYYRNSSNLYPYENANKDLYVKVANIVNTGVVANIPADAEAALHPDQHAAYISSVEGVADDYGVWNINDMILNSIYKTAGKYSIQKKLDYNSKTDDAVMTYIFDTTADMSDLSAINFDFFIDLPQYLNKPTNKVQFCVANDRFCESDYYYWNIDLTKLKQGWNSLSFSINNANAAGKPDLKSVKAIVLRFTELDLDKDNYEEILYGIDNLRYISATGNKVLRVADADDGELEDFGLSDLGLNDLSDFDVLDDDLDGLGAEARTKYKKIRERLIVTDWLYTGIILGGEALLIAAGVAVFILIYRKKRKKSDG